MLDPYFEKSLMEYNRVLGMFKAKAIAKYGKRAKKWFAK